ncbi:hypothetical protein LZ30DRAFT_60713 [Colletotrichum cereale]|nr:hypothetical protein LZ30DRAFT_60713 [Colletotrichum cereale]
MMEQRPEKYHRSRAQNRRDDHLGHLHSPPRGLGTAAYHFYSNPRRGDRTSGVALASDAGNSADLVENWLSNVSRRGLTLPKPLDEYHRGQVQLNDSAWMPHGLPLEDAHRRSHKRTRSQDSSIIANPAEVAALLPPTTRRHRNKKSTEPNDTIDLPGTPSPRFEKRPRHKTREDRYDTQERVRQRVKKGQEKRRAPSNDLPRKMSSSGRGVMDNFRSEVILNDRLTLQPCLTPGLFQNGRVSSSKPVEELAFNSMASLEHPPPHQSSWQQRKRSQAKQSQRRERELEEMAVLLGRKETPVGQHEEKGQWRYNENSENRQKGEQLLDEYSVRTVPQISSTRMMVKEADLGRDGTRQPPQVKADSRPTRPLRSSSRATSYITWSTSSNNQKPISDDNNDRSSSSPPEPVREALWESGVFSGTGLRGKGSNIKANFHQADDLCNQNLTLQEWEEHVSLKKPTTVVRYTDKGVMTNNELYLPVDGSKALETSESSRSSKVVARTDLPTLPATNSTLPKNVQTYCSAAVDCETTPHPTRADAATQACFGLQSREDIPTPASSKFFQRILAETPAVDEPTYSRVDNIDMQSTTAGWPHIEVAPTSRLGKRTAAQPQNEEVRKTESAVFSVSWTPSSANDSRHIDHLLARDSMLHYQPAFLENKPPTSGSNNQLRNETGCEKEVITLPWTKPQTTLQGSQQKGLPRVLTAQGHRSAPRLDVSQFQSSKSMADFITRIEQDALRNEKHGMTYRQRADDFSTAVGQPVGGSAQTRGYSGFDQLPEESDCVHLRDANADANRPQARPFAELFAQPRNYQRPGPHQFIDQTEAYEQEEMKAFWRPNYFYY